MKIAMILNILFSTLLFFSCTKEPVQINNDTTSTTAKVPTTLNKTLMLKLINEARSKGCQCGDTYYYSAPALGWNDLLEKAAFNHSNDMYENKYFAHTALDGSNAGMRIERVGYNWKAYGENIGMGYKDEKEVVEAWLASPGHCKNLMNKNYKEVGVSRVGGYWTQAFGTR